MATGQNGRMNTSGPPGPSATPAPPYFAVIFTATRDEQPGDGFADTDEHLFALAERQPGFLGYETSAGDGLGITVSYWETEDAIRGLEGAGRARGRAARRPRALVRFLRRSRRHESSARTASRGRFPDRAAMKSAPPGRITLGDDLVLRLVRVNDAAVVARSVRESLEHLQPWMPWADDESARETFQRQRLRGARHKAAMGEEWQYGLFPRDESMLVGAFGLIARKWPATIEIGYWVHVDAIGRGYAPRATRALTNAALTLDGITTVCIRCDEANVTQRGGAPPARVHPRPHRDARTRSARPSRVASWCGSVTTRSSSYRGSTSASSIRAMAVASRRSITSRATRFSRTWSTRLAPVITVDTWGFFAHHASDIWASVHSRSEATAIRRRTRSLVFSLFIAWCSHS